MVTRRVGGRANEGRGGTPAGGRPGARADRLRRAKSLGGDAVRGVRRDERLGTRATARSIDARVEVFWRRKRDSAKHGTLFRLWTSDRVESRIHVFGGLPRHTLDDREKVPSRVEQGPDPPTERFSAFDGRQTNASKIRRHTSSIDGERKNETVRTGSFFIREVCRSTRLRSCARSAPLAPP